jgi:sugar O-acyltransferase (sialic acid O-acetyltransferase NeuD family)
MSVPVIVLGGGGHARVLIDMILELDRTVLGYTTTYSDYEHNPLFGVPWLGDDTYVLTLDKTACELVNGVGSVRNVEPRANLYDKFHRQGYRFATIVHPTAFVSKRATLQEGVQVMAGAVIQANSTIGVNTIVNTRASVDHDCTIGNHVHIAPGATLSGGVQVGDKTHIGAGATIIQGIRIGQGCLVAAGAVVVHDVPDGAKVAGVPGRVLSQ